MLINAAISGRADHLIGLKENVIIGRKIPVGTGARDEIDEDSSHDDVDVAEAIEQDIELAA